MFPPVVTVSGLSVLYLKVNAGILRVIASSWSSQESVKISVDLRLIIKNLGIQWVLQCEHGLNCSIHQID